MGEEIAESWREGAGGGLREEAACVWGRGGEDRWEGAGGWVRGTGKAAEDAGYGEPTAQPSGRVLP
jgi:hypothetical protein